MSGISKKEQVAKRQLYDMGYKYLVDNFHKFSDPLKIKIALEVYKKERPSEMKHTASVSGHSEFFAGMLKRAKQVEDENTFLGVESSSDLSKM